MAADRDAGRDADVRAALLAAARAMVESQVQNPHGDPPPNRLFPGLSDAQIDAVLAVWMDGNEGGGE